MTWGAADLSSGEPCFTARDFWGKPGLEAACMHSVETDTDLLAVAATRIDM